MHARSDLLGEDTRIHLEDIAALTIAPDSE
jgi:hypothetical protein